MCIVAWSLHQPIQERTQRDEATYAFIWLSDYTHQLEEVAWLWWLLLRSIPGSFLVIWDGASMLQSKMITPSLAARAAKLPF